MFDWLGDIISGLGDAIGGAFDSISDTLIDKILNRYIQWLFELVYNALADFFTNMTSLGGEIFNLSWVAAVVKLFSLFGWSLFVVGLGVSAFDLAIEYQNGRANIQGTALNWIKGFMAVNLFTVTPIELYKFCVSLQNTLSHDLVSLFSSQAGTSLGEVAKYAISFTFNPQGTMINASLYYLAALIALGYCVIKIFFDNIKRGGILLIQIAVGSLYMFSIPRGYGNYYKKAFEKLAQSVMEIFSDICNRKAFINNFNYVFDYPFEVIRYYDVCDEFKAKMEENEFGDIEVIDFQKLAVVNNTTITFDDLIRAFELGYKDKDQICRIKCKYGSIESVLN